MKQDNLIAFGVDGELIKRAKKAKYLGIIIDETLTWVEHITYVSSKIKRNLRVMKRIFHTVQEIH